MFKTILMTAAAALVATAVAAPAHAFVIVNGDGVNGLQRNGIVPNGQFENGIVPNGQFENGGSENGQSLQGTSTGAVAFVIDSIELPPQAR
jgi:hypothetical protein